MTTTERQDEHVMLFEIKQNKILKWKKWCKLLKTAYKHEVQKSLEEEKAEQEMFVSFELNGKTYGLAYLRGECTQSNQAREVNRIHHEKVNECLKRASNAKILYSSIADKNLIYAGGEW